MREYSPDYGASIRGLMSTLVVVTGFWFGSIPVAAHVPDSTGEPGFDLALVLTVVTAVGTSAGLLAASSRARLSDHIVSHLLDRAIGTILVGLGLLAGVSTVLQQPAIGVGGILVGAAAGIAVAVLGSCGVCADVTVGAIATHRVIEGVALAAISTVGSSVGLFGVLVISGHTVVECIAIGGRSGLSSTKAVGAVLFVEAVFVFGVLLGTVGIVTLTAVPQPWLAAIVGGLLVTLGVAEIRPLPRSPLST